MNDELAKALGFDDADEFFKLTSDVDISTDVKMLEFKLWQDGDGTKAGLLEIMKEGTE